jgi:hypothetical protein
LTNCHKFFTIFSLSLHTLQLYSAFPLAFTFDEFKRGLSMKTKSTFVAMSLGLLASGASIAILAILFGF